MVRWIMVGLVLACAACDTILGLSQFSFDASTDACVGPDGCWACTPTNNDQFLNVCTSQCVSFDQTRIAPFLQADGALPPLPSPPEAGTDAGDGGPADTGVSG